MSFSLREPVSTALICQSSVELSKPRGLTVKRMENIPGGNVLIMNSWSHRRLISLCDLSIVAAVVPLQLFFRGRDVRFVHVLFPCAGSVWQVIQIFFLTVLLDVTITQLFNPQRLYVLYDISVCLFKSSIISFFFYSLWHFDRFKWLTTTFLKLAQC